MGHESHKQRREYAKIKITKVEIENLKEMEDLFAIKGNMRV